MYRKLSKLAKVVGVSVPAIALLFTNSATASAVEGSIESETIPIRFEAAIGDETFACGETYRLGTADSAMTLLDFRFYVSDVALIDTEGNRVPMVLEQDGLWQHQNLALLDFEDKTGGCTNGTAETRSEVVGSVPAGDYSGLSFTVGVPFGLNHIDSTLAPSPLNLTSLWWNWNFGYKFARIDFARIDMEPVAATASVHPSSTKAEGHGRDSAAAQAYAFHLGSVGCQMDSAQAPVSCSSPNRATVTLTDFDPTQNVVVADLSALLANTDLTKNQEGTAMGCMSGADDSDCLGIMQSLGLPFQAQPASKQTFFQKR